jgi:hypothetical protein
MKSITYAATMHAYTTYEISLPAMRNAAFHDLATIQILPYHYWVINSYLKSSSMYYSSFKKSIGSKEDKRDAIHMIHHQYPLADLELRDPMHHSVL